MEFRQKANPTVDKITVDGESIVTAESLISNALYKPHNVLCSHSCFGDRGSDGSAATTVTENMLFLLPSISLINITKM